MQTRKVLKRAGMFEIKQDRPFCIGRPVQINLKTHCITTLKTKVVNKFGLELLTP